MDIEAVRNTLEQASLASLAIGLAISFFFSFNPVALAAIPVSLAYVTKAQAPQRAVLLGSMFVLGMIVTHALLGLVVGLGGGWIQRFGRSACPAFGESASCESAPNVQLRHAAP
jgi:cytochrome c-type biogenesis protein